jgi:hypothetical protein
MSTSSYNWGRAVTLTAFLFLVGAQLAGCADSEQGEFKENQPPTVWLSSAPPEGSVEQYVVKMYWGGWDPDGEIAYYEYAITDNETGVFDPADTVGADRWSKVYSNDSTFTFSADVLVDTNTTEQVTDFTRSHTFFIRAVDRRGLASRVPAYRSFTAHTLSPEVSIIVPQQVLLNPANLPAISTYRWEASDYVSDRRTKQDPDSVSWILEPLKFHDDDWTEAFQWIRDLPVDSRKWGDWVWYRAPRDSGRFWTTPPKDVGNYVFAIRAKDEAGAITPVFDERRNMRRILVSKRLNGPILIVQNQYMGSVKTSACNSPVTILDLPAGIPVDFRWTADARHYGGTPAGYRYGWDIKDLNDPDQWAVDFTPFPPHSADEVAAARVAQDDIGLFFFGTHVFTIEVLDNSGYCSRVEVRINIIQFTMEKNLLVIDDFVEGGQGGWDNPVGKGVLPSDAEHDAFWAETLYNVEGFDPANDMMEVRAGTPVPLSDFAKYKSIIWSVLGHVSAKDDKHPALHDLVAFRSKEGAANEGGGKRQPNLVSLFMAAGGHILIAGQNPVSEAVNRQVALVIYYPLIFLYELDARQEMSGDNYDVSQPSGDESFAYLDLCLECMDLAKTDYNRRRNENVKCSVVKQRTVSPTGLRDHTLRAAVPADPNFPRLELRVETAGPGKYHQPSSQGLDTEVYNPQYFMTLCPFVPRNSRGCFEKIYLLESFTPSEPTYGQAVAFWTSTFADRVADAPGTIGARSAVFGFPPVLFTPGSRERPMEGVRGAIEYIVFDEWQLPRAQQ